METKEVISLLQGYVRSLKKGDTVAPDHKAAICAMREVEKLARAACGFVGGIPSDYEMGYLRIHIAKELRMTYEDSIEACTIHVLPDPPLDVYRAAVSILRKCYGLVYCNEADKEVGTLCFMLKNHNKTIEFIDTVSKACSRYKDIIENIWGILGE